MMTLFVIGNDLKLKSSNSPASIVLMEKNYWFKLDTIDTRMTHYLPRKVCNIIDLAQVTLSPDEQSDPIKQSFVQHITHIEMETEYNKPLDCFPPNITFLKLGIRFMQPLSNPLPCTLTHLVLGQNFNFPVNTSNLPPQLTHLEFGDMFNLSVDDLPLSITHLKFGNYSYHPVNKLPPNIVNLHLGYKLSLPV
eukprot:TRINITY_DN11323_c0_g1_i1.p1 TRINITY_DN11323_c0_g1~~TRINITY_DN11323_c0_g1_i1.p1  ORF type:complete len:193 (-),score=15.80 TRINITY_DN11323_c0_g1_i1:72-650(-)